MGAVIDGAYVPFENLARDPARHVALKPEDTARLVKGTLLVHSHPDGLQCPSKMDVETQILLGIPFVILPVSERGPLGKAFSFPQDDVPLLGRPFRYGVLDCYTLCRDFYRRTLDLELDPFPSDWEWWSQKPPLNMYLDGYASQGFTDIQVAEATRPGDVLFMALRSKVPQHAAIVVDAQRILHHPAALNEFDPTRLSCLEVRSIWVRFAVQAARPPEGPP